MKDEINLNVIPKIVVFGATGNQGGAVIRHLLAGDSFRVTAVTRDRGSAAALELAELGAAIVQADPADQASLADAFSGASGVFMVTQPWSGDYRTCLPEQEILQGKNIIWACREAGVKHTVFSSVFNPANLSSGVTHFDSKFALEDLIRRTGLPFTFLRCGIFMDHIGRGFMPMTGRRYSGYFSGHTKIPFLALGDLGQAAALVFSRPELYLNRTVELIGDIVSAYQIIESCCRFSRGKLFTYKAAAPWYLWLFKRRDLLIRQYFEAYNSPGELLLMNGTLNSARAEFPFLTSVCCFLDARFSGHPPNN